MAGWETTDGRRPELEAINVNYPEGYIGLRIYPKELKTQKTGKIYYMPVGTTITAQTDRNPQSGSITRNFFASANVSFSCSTVEARAAITRDEVEQFGGVDAADGQGARIVKRAVMAKMEKAAADACMAAQSPITFGTGEFIATVRDAAKAIKNYGGRLALVCSLEAYGWIMDLQEVQNRLKFSGTPDFDREALLSLRPEVLREMLRNLYAVDEILIGDDTIWPANKVAVVKLPSEEPFSYKLAPELGKTIAYSSDGVEVCEIEANCNRDLLLNDYTAISYFQVVEFNAARKVIQLFADDSSSSGSSSSSSNAGE